MYMATLEEHAQNIKHFYDTHKRMPGYSEMCELFGFASKNAVSRVVEKLVDAGIVEKDARGKLLPLHLSGTLPLLGSIEAGLPSPAEASELERVSVEDLVLPKKGGETYMLTVKGLSMVDAGLHEGDLLVVEKTVHARIGDIVVACIDGEWTVKYLREKKGKKYLEPANPDFHNLYPEESLYVGGVVRGVIRTY
jgi:SOS regulatory protein LexA